MRKLFVLLFSGILVLFYSCSNFDNSHTREYLLWYNQPAGEWDEALPVGNGRLGAMVFGNSDTERIQFNEESLWAGSKIDNNNPQSLNNLGAIQQLIFEGDYKKAGKLASDYMVGTPPRIRSYQTFGDLVLDYHWDEQPQNYKRELHLNKGISTTVFEIGTNRIQQEVFVSAPHDLIAVRISSSEPVSLDVSLMREKDAVVQTTSDGKIFMTGQIIDQDDQKSGPGGAHMKFSSIARLINEGGKLENTVEGIACNEVSTVTIYLTAATNYDIDKLNYSSAIDPFAECEETLKGVDGLPYSEVKEVHIADHSMIFDRVSLSFGEDTLSHMPTDQRLNRIKEGAIDNGLVANYFQFGRYLLMGSSREPGRLPANLQGVWNEHFNAPWNSDFHTNINLQMNYWPAEVCNLSETSLILTGFVEKLTEPGAVTARKMYGANGWTMHHLTDVFGRTGVADGVWGISPLDGAWMTFPIYRHFEFTRDTAYLQSIYPILKGSAEFVMDFLIESPEGYLVTNPSHSPENAFFVPGTNKKERSQLTYSATTDIQIINKLFDMVTTATRILDTDYLFTEKMAEVRKKLPPVQIGEDGTIMEWIHDYEEVEPGHRHISHLLGLYPLAQITPESPRFYEAAQKTIQRRLSGGGGHTGWSRAWIVNFFARLQDGEKAHENLQALLAKSTKPNLFDNHRPFQIDGNFGGTAGIAEMLLQSHNETIRLLPALPKAWSNGSVKGLKARGGFECDIFWSDGQLAKAVIRSEKGGQVAVEYGPEKFTIDLQPGAQYVYSNN
ncbi:MAG: glycoside hydrolase family 95 protein [Cyclobacteriaceae bacterium]